MSRSWLRQLMLKIVSQNREDQKTFSTIPQSYTRMMTLPHDRYIEADDSFDLTTIRYGIVFVSAVWSGASQLSFRKLNQCLAPYHSRDNVAVYIIDTESITAERLFAQTSGPRGGYGETFFFRKGKPVAQFDPRNDEELRGCKHYP